MNSEFVLSQGAGQKLEFAVQRNGGSAEDIEYLSTGENFRVVTLLRMGKVKLIEVLDLGGSGLGTGDDGYGAVVPPTSSQPSRRPTLEVKDVHNGASFLEGAEFMCRAKLLHGWVNANQKAYEYYSKREHWSEINVPNDVNVIVFANTEFDSDGRRLVRCLCRYGAEWYRRYCWVGFKFHSHCRVAVLASPLN